MAKKLIIGVVVLLALAGGGYYLYTTGMLDTYLGGAAEEPQATGPSGDIDEAIAAITASAQAEADLVTGDEGDLTLAEGQANDISSATDVYVQGEF